MYCADELPLLSPFSDLKRSAQGWQAAEQRYLQTLSSHSGCSIPCCFAYTGNDVLGIIAQVLGKENSVFGAEQGGEGEAKNVENVDNVDNLQTQ